MSCSLANTCTVKENTSKITQAERGRERERKIERERVRLRVRERGKE